MRTAPTIESLLARVDRTDSGCWVWNRGRTVRGGYGQWNIGGKVSKAHRVSWVLFRGEIGEGLFVCHKCDNPPCCNPDHLFLGTSGENTLDAWRKGRLPLPKNAPRGEQHHSAKLTQSDVEVVRSSRATGVELAAKYGVSKTMISRIRKGKAWKST